MLAPFAELALGVGAAVLSIDGIKKAVSGAIAQAGVDSAQGRAASMSGIPIAAYSSFGSAVQSLGGDKSAAEQTLSNLAQQQQAASVGNVSPAMQLLEQLGISPNQSVSSIMAQLNQRFQGMAPAQATYVSSLLGLDPGTTYMLEQTPAKSRAALQAGAADQITPAQNAAEQGITQSYAGVLQALDNLSRDVTADAAPNLIRMLDGLKDFITWIDTQGASWFSQHFSNTALTKDATSLWGDARDFVFGARGVRNNNPLNLKFANQPGATADSGGFAVFGSMNDGIRADHHQLMLDYGRGDNTINKIVPAWTTTDRTAYAATVLKRMREQGYNITGDTQLDLTNPAVAQALMSGMSVAEGNGKIWNSNTGTPNSVNTVLANLRSHGAYRGGSGGGVHHHDAAQINVTVHVPSGDPHTIAHVVKRELQKAGAKASNSAGGALG